MKKAPYILLMVLLMACDKEQEQASPFGYGQYFAVSMVSDIPIDGNFDGIYSTDFRSEFLSESIRNQSSFKFFSSENNTSAFIVMLPTMSRFPPEFETDVTNILNRGTFAHISNSDRSIVSIQPVLDRYGNPTETKIIDVKIIDKETVRLKFYHTLIYDIPTASWKTINVEGIYKRDKNL